MSTAIKKVALGGLVVLLASIVIPVVVPICLFFAMVLVPIFAVWSVRKIFASLHTTQNQPRLQRNDKLLPLIPFEFVDTDKKFSKPAKVFLSIGVILALMVLFPLILLFHIVWGFVEVFFNILRLRFEKLKELAFCFVGPNGSTKREVKIDDSVMQNLAPLEQKVESPEEVILEMLGKFNSTVNIIKNKYTNSALEENGIKKHIKEFCRMKEVCSVDSLRDCSLSDADIKVFGESLSEIYSFVKLDVCLRENEECNDNLQNYRPDLFSDNYKALRDAQKNREQERISLVPSEKLDSVNQNSAVCIGESLILR